MDFLTGGPQVPQACRVRQTAHSNPRRELRLAVSRANRPPHHSRNSVALIAMVETRAGFTGASPVASAPRGAMTGSWRRRPCRGQGGLRLGFDNPARRR